MMQNLVAERHYFYGNNVSLQTNRNIIQRIKKNKEAEK